MVVAVLRLGGRPDADAADRPHGQGIKRELVVLRDEDVHNGRLYPNLSGLVDANLLHKGERDRRTNTYRATDRATDCFAAYLSTYAGIDVDDAVVGVMARRAYDAQTHAGSA
jgi:hypothetical protein